MDFNRALNGGYTIRGGVSTAITTCFQPLICEDEEIEYIPFTNRGDKLCNKREK